MTDDHASRPDETTPAPPAPKEPVAATVADRPQLPETMEEGDEGLPDASAGEPVPEEPMMLADVSQQTQDASPEPAESEPLGQPPADATDSPAGEEKPKKSTRKPRKTKAEAEAEPVVAMPADGAAAPAAVLPAEGAADSKKKWYVVKVTSGREDTIKAAIERKVKIEGLEEFFGQIAIPVEELVQKKTVRVTDKKTGEKVTQEKKVIKYQKKFPGYIFAEVEFNDRILYLFRETSGVGDFVGVGGNLNREPTPMTDREVRAMLVGVADGEHGMSGQKQKVKLDYEKGDKVKIRDGAFANMEGIVKSITEVKDTGETPKVKVEVTIFGRPVEVDLDYWHVDKA